MWQRTRCCERAGSLSSLLLYWLHVVAWAFNVGAAYKLRLLNKTLFRL
jgi:hypothetical protein